jgi:hypothetical protein
LEERIKEVPENLKQVEDIGTALLELALEGARDLYRRLCEALDEYLLKVRDKELKVEHIRERWVSTPLGDIRIKRRQYIDGKGESRYLLDEVLGLVRKSPIIPALREVGIFLATLLPFQKSSEVMEKSLPRPL